MKKTITIIILSLIIAGGIATWKFYNKSKTQPTKPAVCTQEAKICLDGSYVGRTGPNCEFQACPAAIPTQTNADWKTFSDPTQKISFQYPETLNTKYIRTQVWPPKIMVSNDAFTCNPTPDQKGLPETTNQKNINEKNYCIDITSEGAAGTIYNTYDYFTETNNKLASISFILAYPECANYPDPQMTECQTERTNFNLDSLIDQIAQSVKTS